MHEEMTPEESVNIVDVRVTHTAALLHFHGSRMDFLTIDLLSVFVRITKILNCKSGVTNAHLSNNMDDKQNKFFSNTGALTATRPTKCQNDLHIVLILRSLLVTLDFLK